MIYDFQHEGSALFSHTRVYIYTPVHWHTVTQNYKSISNLTRLRRTNVQDANEIYNIHLSGIGFSFHRSPIFIRLLRTECVDKVFNCYLIRSYVYWTVHTYV